MSGQKIEYIIFPLNMIQGLLTADESKTKQIVSNIMFFGIANFALNYTKYDDAIISRQALYLYYRKRLPDSFMKAASKAVEAGKLEINDETLGFTSDGDSFSPERWELDSIQRFIKSNAYNNVWDFSKLSFYLSADQIEYCQSLYEKIITSQKAFEKKHGKDVTASLKLTLMYDFFKEPPAPDLLAAYIALRSLQGRKQGYLKTFKKTILLRMSGCKSNDVFQNIETSELLTRIEQIAKRKTFEKLLSRLAERGFLTGRFILPNTNFFLLSTSVDTIEIARLFAETKLKANNSKKQDEALKLFNQLTEK